MFLSANKAKEFWLANNVENFVVEVDFFKLSGCSNLATQISATTMANAAK